MAMSLANHIASLEWQAPGGGMTHFAEVFETWPAFIDRFVSPSACVLPGDWKYGDSAFSPKLLEDTWENPGEPGFALYKVSEIECDLEISMRASSPAECEAAIRGVEEAFQNPGFLMDDPQGAQYGRWLTLPEYFGVPVRFALKGGRVIDNEDTAMREQRNAVITVMAQAPQVIVGPVYPLAANVVVKVTRGG